MGAVILALLLFSGCATPETNAFCADRCEMAGGFPVKSEKWDGGTVFCECTFRDVVLP